MASPLYIPTNNVWRFPFFHILAKTCCCYLFHDSYSDRYKMISHCSFHLHFSDGEGFFEYLFMCLLAIYCFFGKMTVQILCWSFLIGSFVFLVLSCTSSLYILDCIRYIICKYLLQFSRWPFCFVDSYLGWAKDFDLMQSTLFTFVFVSLAWEEAKECY